MHPCRPELAEYKTEYIPTTSADFLFADKKSEARRPL